MADKLPSIRDELLGYKPTDPFVINAVQEALRIASGFDLARSMPPLNICLIDPEIASLALRKSDYFTLACQAMIDEGLIIINEQFLLRVECAIRSFALAGTVMSTPFLQSDMRMFALLWRSRMPAYRERLRRLISSVDPDLEQQVQQEFSLVVLFFLSHEIGHFMKGHSRGQFAPSLSMGKRLEDQIDVATVRLSRHLDEFVALGFGLPGFIEAAQKNNLMRRPTERNRRKDPILHQHNDVFFSNEAEADSWATDLLDEHLRDLTRANPTFGQRAFYLFTRGLFSAALINWYQDLDMFARKIGIPRIRDTSELTIGMLRGGKERYVHAASLFGEHHKFTLLRAVLTLQSILRSQSSWFDQPKDKRSIWCDFAGPGVKDNHEQQVAVWVSESLQRYFVLSAHMDTAVKLASIGATVQWMIDVEKKRGKPQWFQMVFRGIDESMRIVKRFS